MNEQKNRTSIMILAGEASGDLHGANLVKAIRKLDDTITFLGTGGELLRQEGVELFFDIKSLSVMGLTEVIARLHVILRALNEAKRLLKNRRPNLLVLIDFPEFNLMVAKEAKKLGIPVLYYISPKVWAWRSGRVKTIKKRVDRMAIILPFESQFYRLHDVAVTYVGHPLMDTDIGQASQKPDYREKKEWTIALLPGSREKEVAGLLPEMMAAAQLLSSEIDNLKFLVSVAPSIDSPMIDDIVSSYRKRVDFDITTDNVSHIFKIADFAMAASGTVTLEAAIAGLPMVVLYKMSAMSYFFAKRLVKLEFACLVNLIAGKEVVPELLQDEANPKNISSTIKGLLLDENLMDDMREGLIKVKRALGGPGASDRVAEIALEMMA